MKKAFTLIELIIVIAIIGILTALIMPNFMAGRIRARDAAKKADMRSFKQALQLYYNDYQQYPDAVGTFGRDLLGCGTNGVDECDADEGGSFETDTTTYLKKFPDNFQYYPDNSNDTYLLRIQLENASDEDIDKSLTTCNSECENKYGTVPCATPSTETYYYVCPD